RLQKRLSEDRPYYKDLYSVFQKQIQDLLQEKKEILSLTIKNPPSWLIHLNGKELPKSETHYVPENIVNFSPSASSNENEVYQLIKKFPKTEVHLHLEACINKDTLRFLFEKNEIPIDEEEFEEKFNFKDLNGFIQLFFYIQNAIKEEEDFAYMVDSLADYLREDNIVYAEVFVAPTRFVQNGLDFFKIMDVILDRVREIRKEDGTDIRLLVDVSRTFGLDNALANLEKVLKISHHEEILGIGLGGAELLGPARDYEKVFRIARE
ncbi:MAG: adenosine deaminase, partial [Leptospiraceae bacterium]|nr:adenosine deaminase [Leptospiraceae bacterium]